MIKRTVTKYKVLSYCWTAICLEICKIHECGWKLGELLKIIGLLDLCDQENVRHESVFRLAFHEI